MLCPEVDASPTLASAIEGFLQHLVVERRSPEPTVRGYRHDLRVFRRFLPAEFDTLARVTPAAVRAWFASTVETIAPATAARRLATLKGFFRWAIREGLVTTSPCAGLSTPRLVTREPEVLSKAAIAALLDAPWPETAVAARDRAVIETLYATACRVAELCAVDVVDVYRESGEVRLWGKGQKERIVPVGERALEAIDRYWPLRMRWHARPRRDHGDPCFVGMFGERVSTNKVRELLARRARLVGLPMPVTPHLLRHTAATHLHEAGMSDLDLQKILGHTNLQQTRRYTRSSRPHLREVYARYHPRAT